MGATLVRSHGSAALQFDLPIVQQTSHSLAVDQALGQRTVLIRAAVIEDEGLVVDGAEDDDVVFRAGNCTRAQRVDFVEGADIQPVRRSTSVGGGPPWDDSDKGFRRFSVA